MRLRLVPQETNFDFFKYARATFGASIVAVIASLAIWLSVGLNFGIDFLGGTTIRTDATVEVDVAEYRAALDELDLGDVVISRVFDPNFDEDQFVVTVRIQAQEGVEAVTSDTIRDIEEALGSAMGGPLTMRFRGAGLTTAGVMEAIASLSLDATPSENGVGFSLPEGLPLGTIASVDEAVGSAFPALEGSTFTYERIAFPSVESVGPKVSGELIQTAIIAVLASLGAILIYIWLRFEWQFSVGAVAALIHDVILTIGVFSLFQIRFDLATIAALLTIVGYSINDTVVIFDRLRENLIKYKQRALRDVMNLSANETLSRTLMTSGTTLIALIALIVLGGDVIRGFVFAIAWGVIVGTYSSIYVAKNVVLMIGVKRDWSKPSDGGGAGGPGGTQFANVDA
ncbi:protein translocase subunit SecF [Hasllibacter sp. MH4015]|uniref:protein translocase subunit SecF n=1 Tax=Hasllibacter sp. MH4015 TaxID=2854029 RepID=UPI001CD3D748|nr:protein translocase subunit SecF [Hasllibacter sp. MH4015]